MMIEVAGRRALPAPRTVVSVCAMNAGSVSAAVGRRMQQLRRHAGLSVERLAKKVGLSASALQRIEEGGAQASVGTLSDIAGHLGTTLAQLVREAAQLEETTVSRFVLETVTERARHVVADHRDIVLSNQAFDRFITELDRPAA